MSETQKVEFESELKYNRQESAMQSKIWNETIEKLERQYNGKQTEVWKLNMVVSGLEKRLVESELEVERLMRIRDISSMQAELPNTCVEDLTSERRMAEVKSSALQEALNKLKDNDTGRNEMIQKIEELE